MFAIVACPFGALSAVIALGRRDGLPLDATFEGPAILEQLDCTTVVEPGDKVRQDKIGNLLISVG